LTEAPAERRRPRHPATIYASIHRGKYDADNTYGLVAYDPTVGAAGDWKHVPPVENVSGG
jgi:hypothetical protein